MFRSAGALNVLVICVCVCERERERERFTYAFFIFAQKCWNLVKFYDEFTRKLINEIHKCKLKRLF